MQTPVKSVEVGLYSLSPFLVLLRNLTIEIEEWMRRGQTPCCEANQIFIYFAHANNNLVQCFIV